MIGIKDVFWHSPFGNVMDLFSTAQSGIRYKILVDEQGVFSPTLTFGSFKVPSIWGRSFEFFTSRNTPFSFTNNRVGR